MKQFLIKYRLLIILILATWAYELVTRISTVGNFVGIGIVISLGAAMIAGTLQYLIAILFKERARKPVACVLTVIYALLCGGQVVYNGIFYTYYTVYSMTHGADVAQFWREIVEGILNQIIPVLAIATFAVLAILLIKGSDASRRFKASIIPIILGAVIVAVSVAASGTAANSPYDTIFKTNSIDDSIENLGVGAALVLDAERLVFGFEPEIEIKEEIIEEIEVEPEYGFNESDIDFEELAASETDDTLAMMNKYFSTVMPSKQNEKTGMFAGKNLIFVVGESFSTFAISEKYTPTLYKLQREGFTFPNFYNPIWGVSTSDGEYVACTGLLPKSGVWSMQTSSKNRMALTLGTQFMDMGYKTYAYHNHYAEYYGRTDSHPNLGYVYKGLGTGLKVKEQWPESDLEMIELTTSEYLTPDENGEIAPFHVYYLTVSGHLNYNFYGNAMCVKNKDAVADLEMSDACKAYIACNIELDKAMEKLLADLEAAGELEDTVIVLSGDHYPYGLTNEEISEFLGHEVEPQFELYESSLIIYNKGMQPKTIRKYCSSLDILPTVLNLFGVEFDSRLLMGRDIFSDSTPLVIFKDKSWITDVCMYNAATKEVIPHEGQEVTQEYIEGINNRVENKFTYSRLILERDYYRYLGI